MTNRIKKEKAKKRTASLSFFRLHQYSIIVFIFSFFLFSNSILNDYNLDDELVTRNHRLTEQGISAIPEIFTTSYYTDAMGYAYEYRPMVLSSFAIEHQFLGEKSHTSHFINVLLYACCCVLLYIVLLNISSLFTPVFSLVVALLFAAHSSHTEVVCSIKNRDELLGLLLSLVALFISLRSINKSKPILLVLLPFAFGAALMSKITFLPFTFIIMLSVILFTKANYKTVLVLSILLSIPVFLLLPVEILFHRIVFTMSIPVSGTILYVSVNASEIKARILKCGLDLRNWIITWSSDSDSPSTFEQYRFNNFKDLIAKAIPPKEYIELFPISLAFLLLGLYIGGIFYSNASLTCIALVVLLLVGLKGNNKIAWWSTLAFYVAIATFPKTVLENDKNLPFHIDIVILIVVYDLFYSSRKFFLPALILGFLFLVNLATGIIIYYPPPNEPLVYGVLLMFMSVYIAYLALFGKRRPNLIFVLIIMSIINILLFWFLTPTFTPFFLIIFITFGVIKKWNKTLPFFLWGGKAILILLIIFRQTASPPPPPTHYADKMSLLIPQVNAIGEQNRISLLPAKHDRPISYVEQPISQNDPWQIKIGTSMHVLHHYFIKTIIPYPLAFYYGYKFIAPEKLNEPIPILSVVVHLLLILIMVWLLNRNRRISFGIAVYLISIVAFSNYLLPVPGIVGDRYMLLPSLGWCIVLASILFRMGGINNETNNFTFTNAPKVFKYAVTILLIVYSGITFSRNFDWKDDLTLFRHDINYVSQSSQAHNLLALHLMQHSEKEQDQVKQEELKKEALIHFKKALEIYPPFFNVAYDIGRVYMSLNMADSAINAFKYTLTLDTSFRDVQLNIGKLFSQQGKLEDAIPYLENVIQYRSYDYTAYDMLSFIYFKLNKPDKSIEINRQAVLQMPLSPDPLVNIGHVYQNAQQMDSARYYFQKANEVSPGNPAIQKLLQQVSIP